MTTTSEKIMKVIETIHREGYSNLQWSVVTSEVNSKQHYGAENKDVTLKPHIAVWVPKVDVKIWVLVAVWDHILFTEDDDLIAIFEF